MFLHDWHGEGKRNERRHLDGTSFGCLPFDGGDVGSVDEHCTAGILHGYWTVPNEVVVQDVFEVLLRRPANHGVELSSAISRFDFTSVETIFVASYGQNKRVAGNIGANVFRCRCVMKV